MDTEIGPMIHVTVLESTRPSVRKTLILIQGVVTPLAVSGNRSLLKVSASPDK